MSKKMLFYSGLIFVIANLFYAEFWGLNALIASFAYVAFSAIMSHSNGKINLFKSPKWWFAALLFIGNGFAVFYTNTSLASGFYLVNFLLFAAIHNEIKISIPLGLAQSLQSFFAGFYYFIESISQLFEKNDGKDRKKTLVKVLLYTIPLVIAIVFLKLYQSADETFYEYTKFINLDWISWNFIIFYIILFIAFFGLYFFKSNHGINHLEDNLKNNIDAGYSDKVEQYMGVKNEQKIAMSLLITLNLILVLYNFIDLRFIFIDLPNPDPTLRYAELLHGGVDSLIASIILVIIIITSIYRGQLNFQGSKLIRTLALIWLLQNIVMVATTVVKNYEYITHWGLTYKRIGVYIYLILAATGLIFTIIKILKVKSVWYLIRNTSLAFLTCFTLMGLINWDKIIVNYNLSQLPAEQIDFPYLMDLENEAYPALISYYKDNKKSPEITENRRLWHNLFVDFESTRKALQIKKNAGTWRSINIRETQILNEMERFNLVYENQLTHNRSN